MSQETQEIIALWLPAWAVCVFIAFMLHVVAAPRHRPKRAIWLLFLALASIIGAAVYLVWFFTEGY